jgi:hypothetical protein
VTAWGTLLTANQPLPAIDEALLEYMAKRKAAFPDSNV